MVNRACIQTIILVACKITCGKKGQEKDFPVLRMIQGVARYVECNDNNNDIATIIHAILPCKFCYPTIINFCSFVNRILSTGSECQSIRFIVSI